MTGSFFATDGQGGNNVPGGERVRVAMRLRPMMPHEQERSDSSIVSAYVEEAFAEVGTELSFVVRDKAEPCVVTALPFYKRAK